MTEQVKKRTITDSMEEGSPVPPLLQAIWNVLDWSDGGTDDVWLWMQHAVHLWRHHDAEARSERDVAVPL